MNLLMKSKVRGSLYGYMIGAAMGVTTKFMHKEEIAEKYGVVKDIIGGGFVEARAGDICAEMYMVQQVAKAVFESRTNDDFDMSCFFGLLKGVLLGVNRDANVSFKTLNNNALTNESLLRALPVALLGVDYTDWNTLQSNMTHYNRVVGAVVLDYHRMISSLVNGIPYLQEEGLYNAILEPSSGIKNTYSNAVHWAGADSFSEAITGAVNDGGDADVIAAITGSIAGAKYGMSMIPPAWIRSLDQQLVKFVEEYTSFLSFCM